MLIHPIVKKFATVVLQSVSLWRTEAVLDRSSKVGVGWWDVWLLVGGWVLRRADVHATRHNPSSCPSSFVRPLIALHLAYRHAGAQAVG